MKKSIKFLLSASLLLIVFASCKKDENQVLYEGGTAPKLSASSSANMVLNIANSTNQALAFSWTNPNYKFSTGPSSQNVTYILQIDTTGSNFSNQNIQEFSIANDLSFSMTVKELNKSKTPIVKINKTLDKLATKVLFPGKVEEANAILKTVGLPKPKTFHHR